MKRKKIHWLFYARHQYLLSVLWKDIRNNSWGFMWSWQLVILKSLNSEISNLRYFRSYQLLKRVWSAFSEIRPFYVLWGGNYETDPCESLGQRFLHILSYPTLFFVHLFFSYQLYVLLFMHQQPDFRWIW